jgi:DNA-binding response OmpR family regulator
VTTFGIVRIDHDAHQVNVGDAPVALTALEYQLLLAPVAQPTSSEGEPSSSRRCGASR